MPELMQWCTPLSATVSTMPAESPTSSAPGIVSLGIDQYPPPGSAFAPQATRSPPSRILRTNGCVLKSWSRSCADVVASAYSRSMTNPIETRSSPFLSFIGYSQVPPICPYFEDSFSGHGPMVWMIRSSGLGTFQTSLTPSSQTCGSRPSARSNSLIAAPVRWPQQPSASTVALATTSVPGSKLPSGSPSLPRPLSPVRTPLTSPSSTSSCVALVSVRM